MATRRNHVTKDAEPKGCEPYRHWLSRSWSPDEKTALVVGINPNKATDTEDDGMTHFLVRHLLSLTGEYACGGFILVNCCDLRGRDPKKLKYSKAPCSPKNLATVERILGKCDFVIASWGTSDYGSVVTKRRNEIETIVRRSGKPVICFSPRGKPIYCSQTNKNSNKNKNLPMRWSDIPVPLIFAEPPASPTEWSKSFTCSAVRAKKRASILLISR